MGKTGIFSLVSSLLCFTLFVLPARASFEWSLGEGEKCRIVPDEPALRFPGGFKATVRFACDLDKIGKKSRFANLVTKGRDFTDGWSIMVRNDGQLLVDLKGVRPAYKIVATRIETNREHLLEVYVCTNHVRVFLDGKEVESYWFAGRREGETSPTPLQIGSMGGYTFSGCMSLVRLDPLSDVTLPPGGPEPISFQPPKQQKRAEIKWVRPICVETNRYIGWPTVCRLKNGDIIVVFSGDRDEHVCPFGKVQMVRSSDDGETWMAPQTIANGPIDDRDAGIVQMPDGTLIVTYFTSIAYRTRKFLERAWPNTSQEYWWKRHDEKISDAVRRDALGYFRMISTDNGHTWSKPEKMKGLSHTPHGPILMNDGSLLQLGRTFTAAKLGTTEEGRTIISAWRSTDLGASWTCLCPSVPDTDGENSKPHMFHEPNAIQLPDGTLVGLVRYHGPDNAMRQTVSVDGGRTWTPMTKTPMRGLPPHLIRLADGRLVCVYGRRFRGPCYGEFAMISDDSGRTWDVENEISLAPSHSGDLGYPSSCVLPNGDILTVYYQQPGLDEKPCLMATRWKVK